MWFSTTSVILSALVAHLTTCSAENFTVNATPGQPNPIVFRTMFTGYKQELRNWPKAVMCRGKREQIGHFTYPDTHLDLEKLASAIDLFGSNNYEALPCVPYQYLEDFPTRKCDAVLWAFSGIDGVRVVYDYENVHQPNAGRFWFKSAYWYTVSCSFPSCFGKLTIIRTERKA